jgi:replication-associated recombination protein RarA
MIDRLVNLVKSKCKSAAAAKGFDKIEGYEDIKDIIERALDSEGNYNLLLQGPPASSKTLFLQAILEMEAGEYFDGSNTTNRILDVLEEKRPKVICIDELDKMGRTFQNQLLNFMESGHVKVEQQKKQYDFKIEGAKVFATCNEISRLATPLRSRFRKLFLPRYTQQQFLQVSQKVLQNIAPTLAQTIGQEVWNMQGDIRDVIAIGKLVRKGDGPEQIKRLIRTMERYAETKENCVEGNENDSRDEEE